MNKMKYIFNFLFILSEPNTYAVEKTQLYCVENLNQYEKLTYLGNNIIVEGNFISLYVNNPSILIETVYFKLNEEHSLKVNDYLSSCSSRNIQVIQKYRDKYIDFIIVANINNISFSKFNVKYKYYRPSFGLRIPNTTRIFYTGTQNIFIPNIFRTNFEVINSKFVRFF